MSIEISGEIEAKLTNEARRLGISVETLLARLVSDWTTRAEAAEVKAELPAWQLGVIGVLHRRDIYEDGR